MTIRKMTAFVIMCLACIQIFVDKGLCQIGERLRTENDRQRLQPLLSVAKANGISVWVEYQGPCSTDGSESIPLNLIIGAKYERQHTTALAAVRAVIQAGDSVSITQNRSEIIDVKGLDVWTPALHSKLNALKLSEIERYNPNAAIEAGIRASQASLEKLSARPAVGFGGLREIPSKARPHLSASSRYGTLYNLLDDVVRKFGGVLVYKECGLSNGAHLFNITLYRE